MILIHNFGFALAITFQVDSWQSRKNKYKQLQPPHSTNEMQNIQVSKKKNIIQYAL